MCRVDMESILQNVRVLPRYIHCALKLMAALKSEALAYRFTHDPADVQSTSDRLDLLYKYHGRATGLSPFFHK